MTVVGSAVFSLTSVADQEADVQCHLVSAQTLLLHASGQPRPIRAAGIQYSASLKSSAFAKKICGQDP